MFFHSAVKATVLNQATPSYVVERESSFHSACLDGEVNKTEVIFKRQATDGIHRDQLFGRREKSWHSGPKWLRSYKNKINPKALMTWAKRQRSLSLSYLCMMCIYSKYSTNKMMCSCNTPDYSNTTVSINGDSFEQSSRGKVIYLFSLFSRHTPQTLLKWPYFTLFGTATSFSLCLC